jgi:hypothetical protein
LNGHRSTPEALALGLVGAVLGAATGRLVRLPVVGAVVGGLNGFIAGSRRIYDVRSRRGVVAFLLDSSWALLTTAGGLAAHLFSIVGSGSRGPGFVPELSARRNRHVYERGFVVRRGFAVTIGNVVCGVGTSDQDREPDRFRRRRSLVEYHEELHVWQARWFGPLFPLAYGAWMLGGAVVGTISWLSAGRRGVLYTEVDHRAYWRNPFERWAYAHAARLQRIEEAQQCLVEG